MEIEFKLSCTAATASTLRTQLTELTGRTPQRLKLQNTYYDTPQQALRAHGIALRIRRQGKRVLQTVKCAGQVHGGLSRRPEWEASYRRKFDFSGIDDADVRSRLETLEQSPGYSATLTTDFEREIWYWRPQSDTCIEIALDRGLIDAGGRQAPICEVELELIEGQPERLFDLVALLSNVAPLFPAPLSKATRGSLLLSGKSPQLPPPETSRCTNEAAFQLLMQHALDHISLNLPANCPDFDAENLHQVRVGLRRLRALLRLFDPLLRSDWCRSAIEDGARTHMRVLDAARTLHVILDELLPEAHQGMAARAWQALQTRFNRQHYAALASAREYLLAHEFSYWLLHSSLALHAHPLRPKAAARAWTTTVPALLADRLSRFRKRLHKKPSSPDALHRLRKAGKHLRYQIAAAGAEWIGYKPAARKLAELQDLLGHLNDLHSAEAFLNELSANDLPAVRSMSTWCHEQQHVPQHALSKLRRTLRHKLADMRPDKGQGK